MNLTARIKQQLDKNRNSNYKPNYILNVNINIPIRSSQFGSDKPLSGEFAFSPNQIKKKVKVQLPSARTTYECESRKLSYLGDTINTISHRINTRKCIAKSAQPSILNSQLKNAYKKSKNQYRSEATSPVRKKLNNKLSSGKLAISNKNITNKQWINELMNQSQDNIIGYTNQSLEALKLGRNSIKKVDEKGQKAGYFDFLKKLNIKSQSPMLQKPSMLQQIREYERSAQYRKQHLNYIYLKQKVLVLASVKKIQRAWRNYKTKKLIKSYSNNISLKFTGKIKNQLQTKQGEQIKVLTVRSCGHHGKNNGIKKNGKKNSCQFSQKNDIEDIERGSEWRAEEEKNTDDQIQKKSQNKRDKKTTQKSAIVKFQIQQINKWQQLIKDIRTGKNVEQVLQKSFKRKQQLQKQIQINIKKINKKQIINHYLNKNQDNQQDINCDNIINMKSQIQKYKMTINQMEVQNMLYSKYDFINYQNQHYQQDNILQQNNFQHLIQQYQLAENCESIYKNKKKLQFFQNQIRKIDNQQSSNNQSQSQHSQTQIQQLNQQDNNQILRGTQQQQNIKLKRKLQAINKIELFNYLQNSNQFQNYEQNKNNALQGIEKQLKIIINETNEPKQFILSNKLKAYKNKDQLLNQYLHVFRNHKQFEQLNQFFYEDQCEQKLKKFRKNKINAKDKQNLAQKVIDELFFDFLLDLSQKDGFISKIQSIYVLSKQDNKQADDIKPQGICTNLQSIKDYLQNFVAFAFGTNFLNKEQQPVKVVNGFNCPNGPSVRTLLKYLNKNEKEQQINFNIPVLSLQLFNLHWLYASEQIYFDAKYPNDHIKQQDRVKHLKSITKTYFRSIFDGFNECLQPFRLYGLGGKAFPWSKHQKKIHQPMILNEIKPLVRLAYKKLSQLSILNCGQLFQDKRHNLAKHMIEQIQQQKMGVLIQIQLQDTQIKWNVKQIDLSQIVWNVYLCVQEILMMEIWWDINIIKVTS